jgi:hypothetical protein
MTKRHLPLTRADCVNGPRPCPYVSCRHHLFLEVSGDGMILRNFPLLEPWEMTESCALDVADRGAHRAETVGAHLGVTRQRTLQIEVEALNSVQQKLGAKGRATVIGLMESIATERDKRCVSW